MTELKQGKYEHIYKCLHVLKQLQYFYTQCEIVYCNGEKTKFTIETNLQHSDIKTDD